MSDCKIINIEDFKPHVSIPTADENAYVFPLQTFMDIATGKLKITDVDDYEPMFRAIVAEWLGFLGFEVEEPCAD